MEVTRKNFKETLPVVANSILNADFLVIDTEFTGLNNGRDASMFDTPKEYYKRKINGCTEFMLIQYGLCAFQWDENKKHYVYDAFNFYLFPRGKPGPDKMFLCQSSSLDFLASQGFDFNKLIREGISYMTEPTETRLRENLIERQKKAVAEKDNITIPDEHKSQIEDICKRVRQFLDDGKLDELEIDRCNAFIRLLLFQELGARFRNEAFVETKILENKDRVLKVTRLTSDKEVKSRDAEKKQKEWDDLEEAVGFSKVARLISQSGKLVVGHNMLLDFLHTLGHFFQPLPADYSSFKEFAHCMFPKILDTKYMSSLPPFKDKINSSVLQHLLATLSESPFSMPKVEAKSTPGYSQSESKSHEAGYDAYVTGLCFLAMHSHLQRMRGDTDTRVAGAQIAIKPFLNKLYLVKTAHQDSPFINLAGDEPAPSRDHVFHMIFPKEWQRNDITQLFSPFGPITVQFLDEQSALVALGRREHARDVMRTLASHPRVTLTPFARYKDLQDSDEDIVLKVSPKMAAFITKSSPEPSLKLRHASSTCKLSTRKLTQVPRVERTRSNSETNNVPAPASPPPAPAHPTRKRTSSGVFRVNETEPPQKKTELVRSNSDLKRKATPINWRRKKSVSESEKETNDKIEIHMIEKFDKDAKSNCVAAFKESDSWD